MHVQMGNRLAGSRPNVDPHVESVRGVPLQYDLPATLQSAQHGTLFLLRGLKPIGEVPLCDHQQMPVGNRVTVPDGEHQVVAKDDLRSHPRCRKGTFQTSTASRFIGRLWMINLPSSPAFWQATQRHRGWGRLAVRVAWQTGQIWT